MRAFKRPQLSASTAVLPRTARSAFRRNRDKVGTVGVILERTVNRRVGCFSRPASGFSVRRTGKSTNDLIRSEL